MKIHPFVLVPVLIVVLAPAAAGQTSLYFPRLSSTNGTTAGPDDSEYTGIALANLSSGTAALTFTAYGRSGNVITGPGITNPAGRSLKAGEQLALVDTQIFGSGLTAQSSIGWVKVDSTVSGIAGFFLVLNGSLTVLDGADVSSGILTSFIFPEVEDQGFTQIHVANPNNSAANVTFELLKSDGTARVPPVSRTINANGALAELFSSLFPGVTPAGSDYVRATVDKGVVPFEYLGKISQYVEGLNGQDTSAGAITLYSPQYVVGGPDWRTTLSVVNLDSVPGTVTFQFFRDDGTQIGATQQSAILARGKIYITDQAFFLNAGNTLTQGYIQITSSGPKLAGNVVFGDPARSKFSSALPLASAQKTSVVFSQVASNSTYFTGAAILNANSSAVNATIEVFDSQGSSVIRKTEHIPAGQKKSILLTQYFPQLTDQNRSGGYVKATADQGIASFALFGTNNLSVLSAVPPQISPTQGKARVAPFETLTINGSGFDPANAAISVLLIPKTGGPAFTVPVYSATSTTLDITVPPFIDTATGQFSTGDVNIQVVQVTKDRVIASNVVPGPAIEPLPSVPAGVAAGVITKVYALSALTLIRDVSSSAALAPLAARINAMTATLNDLVANIGTVISKKQSVSLTTINGQPAVLDATTLAISDRLILGYLAQFVRPIEPLSLSAPIQLGDRQDQSQCTEDERLNPTLGQICQARIKNETVARLSPQGAQAVARVTWGFGATVIGVMGIGGLVLAGAIGPEVALACGIVWTVGTGYAIAYGTASPVPSSYDTMKDVGANLFDELAKKGVPILGGLKIGHDFATAIEDLVKDSGTAPKGGVALPSYPSNTNPANQPLSVIQKSDGTCPVQLAPGDDRQALCVTANRIEVPPVQTNAALSSLLKPAPDVSQFNGSYSGSYNGTVVATVDAEVYSAPVSGPVQLTVANGSITVSSPSFGSGTLSRDGLVLI